MFCNPSGFSTGGYNDRDGGPSLQCLRFGSALASTLVTSALASESPRIERNYSWRLTVNADSCFDISPLREDEVRNSHESFIADPPL
jgi:hypothetical protein